MKLYLRIEYYYDLNSAYLFFYDENTDDIENPHQAIQITSNELNRKERFVLSHPEDPNYNGYLSIKRRLNLL